MLSALLNTATRTGKAFSLFFYSRILLSLISSLLETLSVLWDTLLPRLMSGELRLGDAEEMVEEI